ncbi:putative importin 11 [Aspergillus saccharolyticus JOP 1030-1]|uniref:ARM repeat-containing protein n=1 Tax=Aspergillus saccharolyticus JOP 1030-1 TaxID=1450539 RepID=A0A318Z7G9_9EURO|nr:ARM repeat-containing protein [Aspergillus saccharolyticus JOP 1030-1]PYH43275.1 ARM repeat-containing protein [Aspergillus saccharolyticus JOP 1030-1]
MASIVELAGEANPLTPHNVLNALVLAASSTQQQVQTGTQQLQNWEKQELYYTYLQDVFLDQSVPSEVRYLSIIQLKNGIDKYWRKTATNAIKKEEKEHIKLRALQAGVVEPAPLLALHNALMLAKIMRYEFPQDWPDGISSIIAFLRSATQPGANPLQLPRTLVILLQIIKELSTARLQRTRANLQSVAPEVFHLLGGIYVDKVNTWAAWLEQGGADETTLLETIEQSLVSLKVIRRLVIAGFEHPNRDKDVREFWVLTHSHFSRFLGFVNGPAAASEQLRRAVEKHLLQLSKLHVEMAKDRPASFALLPDSIRLVQAYWTLVTQLGEKYSELGADGESEGKSLMEKTGLRALLLIRACSKMAFNAAQTFKYQTPQDKEEKKQSVELIKAELFTEDFVVSVMELLVTQFFRFRKNDFQEWEEDPEEWERKEEDISDAWEFSIRSCSEKLFLDLVIHFKELLIPRLLHVFYGFASPENRDVLLKDSLYSAIGLSAASLEQHLDFNNFLQGTLVPEVQLQEQGYNLLRRRIAILLGQWVPVKSSELNRDAVYQIFQHLLSRKDPLNDLVVRISAGRQLKNVLDPFEFSPTEFLPYAPTILQDLMSLVQEVELSETRMGLLDTVRMAVVKMEDHIAPFSDQILSLLPPLWESSGEEHLMKQAILTLLSSLIHSLKQDSVRYHSLILPLIQNSVEPGSETLIYLLDEALDLWAAILMQTPSPASPEILSLIPALMPILEAATDSAPQALQIVESYILLAPQEILSDRIRFPLLVSLETLLKVTTRQRLGVVPRLVELMLRGAETVDGGSESTYNVITRSLLDSSFLPAILEGLHSAYDASQTTGPNRKQTSVYGVVETDYFSVLARLAIAHPRIFTSAVASATNSSEEQALAWILTEWFLHYDNIGSSTQKKLHALALTQLLTLNGPDSQPPAYLLNNLQSYITMWTDIVTELSEDASGANPDDPRGNDYLIYWNNAQTAANDEHEPPENERRRAWDDMDILHKVNIRDFIRERLHSVIVGCGGEQRFQEDWLLNVDREVVAAFGALGLL